MSDQIKELTEIVRELRAELPDMPDYVIAHLAIGAQQVSMLADAIVVLGDIADALNDMRPMVDKRSVH